MKVSENLHLQSDLISIEVALGVNLVSSETSTAPPFSLSVSFTKQSRGARGSVQATGERCDVLMLGRQ